MSSCMPSCCLYYAVLGSFQHVVCSARQILTRIQNLFKWADYSKQFEESFFVHIQFHCLCTILCIIHHSCLFSTHSNPQWKQNSLLCLFYLSVITSTLVYILMFCKIFEWQHSSHSHTLPNYTLWCSSGLDRKPFGEILVILGFPSPFDEFLLSFFLSWWLEITWVYILMFSPLAKILFHSHPGSSLKIWLWIYLVFAVANAITFCPKWPRAWLLLYHSNFYQQLAFHVLLLASVCNWVQ